MIKQLIIEPVKVYTVLKCTDETTGGTTETGVYKSESSAKLAALKQGYWGADADTTIMENIYSDENGNLYRVEPIGKYTDVTAEQKAAIMKSIQSKLTPQELEALNILNKI